MPDYTLTGEMHIRHMFGGLDPVCALLSTWVDLMCQTHLVELYHRRKGAEATLAKKASRFTRLESKIKKCRNVLWAERCKRIEGLPKERLDLLDERLQEDVLAWCESGGLCESDALKEVMTHYPEFRNMFELKQISNHRSM